MVVVVVDCWLLLVEVVLVVVVALRPGNRLVYLRDGSA